MLILRRVHGSFRCMGYWALLLLFHTGPEPVAADGSFSL